MSTSSKDFEPFITAREAAEMLGYALQTVYNKSSSGELPSYRIGRTLRFRRSELEELVVRGGLVEPSK